MQRVLLTGTLSAGGNATRTVIPTADLKHNHAAGVMWIVFSCSGAAGLLVRAADNNTNLSCELFVGPQDEPHTVHIPMAHPNVPWVLGPENDGLEVYIVSEESSGTERYSVMLGVRQFNVNVLNDHDDEIPEVP